MKCLIHHPEPQSYWVREIFNQTHPLDLRILNKPLLEYYIDFCVLNKITQIRIVKSGAPTNIEGYFGNGEKWGVQISYSLANKEDSLSRVLLKNAGFCKDDDLLVIHGYGFIDYDRRDISLAGLDSLKSTRIGSEECSLIVLERTAKPWTIDLSALSYRKVSGLSIITLKSVKDYFSLSLEILKNSTEKFFLPGFSNEPDEFVGMNVIFNPHTVTLHKPLMIGDNVQMLKNAAIGPDSVLGNNVIIDSASTIKNSIIYDQSYVGADLEIENKIVYHNRLINPDTGTFMEIEDKFFISNIDSNIIGYAFRRIVHWLSALILLFIFALPNVIFGLIEILAGHFPKRGEFYITKKFAIMALPIWREKKPGFLTLMFLRFSLDKYPLLLPVLFGKIPLVGNRLRYADVSSRKFINGLPQYKPGVFDYAGTFSETFTDEELKMHELFYLSNINVWLDIKVVLNTLYGRFFNVRKYAINKSCE